MMEIKEVIEVLQGFEAGKKWEYFSNQHSEWRTPDIDEQKDKNYLLNWICWGTKVRLKPEPTTLVLPERIIHMQSTDTLHMKTAELYASMSKAQRKKVGAVLVLPSGVIVPGYNGTPRGSCNNCEEVIEGELRTKPEVLHAELNCILKCAQEGLSCKDAVLYVTLSPCLACASMINQVQIKKVIYKEKYRDVSGIEVLYRYNTFTEEYKGESK